MGIEMAALNKKTQMGTTKVMDVMFNPESYSVDYKVNYQSKADANNRYESLQFSHVNARTLTLDLLFDSTSVWRDSSIATAVTSLLNIPGALSKTVDEYINKLRVLTEIEEESGTPPIITFSWGKFAFTGVIESMKETSTEFAGNGNAVKTKVAITIKECYYVTPTKPAAVPAAQNAAAGALESSQEQNLETTITASVGAMV